MSSASEDEEGRVGHSFYPKKIPSDKLSKEKAKFFKRSFRDKSESSKCKKIREDVAVNYATGSGAVLGITSAPPVVRKGFYYNSDETKSSSLHVNKTSTDGGLPRLSSLGPQSMNLSSPTTTGFLESKSGGERYARGGIPDITSDISSSEQEGGSEMTSSSDESGTDLPDTASRRKERKATKMRSKAAPHHMSHSIPLGTLSGADNDLCAPPEQDSGSGTPVEDKSSSSTNSSTPIPATGHLRSLFDGLSHLYTTSNSRLKRPSAGLGPKSVCDPSCKKMKGGALSVEDCQRDVFIPPMDSSANPHQSVALSGPACCVCPGGIAGSCMGQLVDSKKTPGQAADGSFGPQRLLEGSQGKAHVDHLWLPHPSLAHAHPLLMPFALTWAVLCCVSSMNL